MKRLLWNPVDAGAGLMPKLSPVLHKIAKEGEREDQREQEKDEMECEGVEGCVAWRRARRRVGDDRQELPGREVQYQMD